MNMTAPPKVIAGPPPTRWTRWLFIVTHGLVILAPAGSAALAMRNEHIKATVLPVALMLGLGGMQMRHSRAVALDRPLPCARGSLALLALLVYLPFGWIGYSWAVAQSTIFASIPMILRGRTAALAATGAAAASGWLAYRNVLADTPNPDLPLLIYAVVGDTVFVALLGGALYAAARMVFVVDTLHATQAQFAELAVTRERERISRDLHDVLGQSLSAISLKGDLALRMLAADATAAEREVAGIAETARTALGSMRAITVNQHAVSLATEVAGAMELLGAAGIATSSHVEVPQLRPETEATLAWAVREGVTNVLRHSQARVCRLSAVRTDDHVRLEIVNDGTGGPSGEGRGLVGLAERARSLGGSVAAGHVDGDAYQLVVDIPERSAEP
jgi:two-component system, NarL family, sensor histidine kinase DesK